MNLSESTKRAAMGAAIGVAVGSLIASSTAEESQLPVGVSYVNAEVFESMRDEEHKRGFYTENENPQGSDVIIVYLDAEINGKRTFIRRISPIAQQGKTHIFLEAVEKTVQAFLAEY